MKSKTTLFARSAAVLLTLALALTTLSVPVLAAPATPAPPRLVTDKTELTMLIGEQSSVSIDFDSCRAQIPEEWRYNYNSAYFSSADTNVITVDREGVITAVGPGVAVANAGFAGLVGECVCTVLPHYIYISSTSADVCLGDQFSLTIDSDWDTSKFKYGYRIYDLTTNERSTEAFAISKSGSRFTFTAEEVGRFLIEIVCKTEDDESYVRGCEVMVREPGPDAQKDFYVAADGTVRIPMIRSSVVNISSYDYYTADCEREDEYLRRLKQNDPQLTYEDIAESFELMETGKISAAPWQAAAAYDFVTAEVDGVQVDFPVFKDAPISLSTTDEYIYVTGAEEGDTTIYVSYKVDGGSRITTKTFNVHVTDPKCVPMEDMLEAGKDYAPEFKSLAAGSRITSVRAERKQRFTAPYAVSEETEEQGPLYVKCTTDDEGNIVSFRTVGSGDAVLTITADGKEFAQDVVFVDPQLTYDSITLGKNMDHPLGVTGIPDDMDVFYLSLNPSIVTVDADGTVHSGKTKGKTSIVVFVGDKWEFKCGVTVGTTKAIQALLQAEAVLGAEYSQAKRMKVGYYDCSSLVFRTFRDAGYNFAPSYTTNGPTAAETARLMENAGYVISYSYLPAEELLPGDLIFYQTTTNNKRYRNIGHVAFYYGPSYDPQFGGEIDTGKILHAFDSVEFYDYANFRTERIVMIARPFKN